MERMRGSEVVCDLPKIKKKPLLVNFSVACPLVTLHDADQELVPPFLGVLDFLLLRSLLL